MTAGTIPRSSRACGPESWRSASPSWASEGVDRTSLRFSRGFPRTRCPLYYGTASYGYGWLPDQWLFQVRPTYVQEFLTAFVWYAQQHPEKKPLKLGHFSVNIQASLDSTKGFQKYFREVLEAQGIGKIVAHEFSELTPVDLSSQVKKMIDAKADIVMGPITTAMSIAYIRACQTYGVNIPTIAAPHHTIYAYASAMKTYEPFEGHLVVAAHASVTEKDSPAYKWFQVLMQKYGLDEKLWNVDGMMALNQSILAGPGRGTCGQRRWEVKTDRPGRLQCHVHGALHL